MSEPAVTQNKPEQTDGTAPNTSDPDAIPKAHDWATVRADYEGIELTVDEIAEKYQITKYALYNQARDQGWNRRNHTVPDREEIIARMFRVLNQQVIDLENEMESMRKDKRRSGEKEVAVLGKLAANLEKLVAINVGDSGQQTRPRTKQMDALRSKLIERIEQLKRG